MWGLASALAAQVAAAQGGQDVESFILMSGLDDRSANTLRSCPPDVQQQVLARGPASDARNPSGAVMGRIRDATGGLMGAGSGPYIPGKGQMPGKGAGFALGKGKGKMGAAAEPAWGIPHLKESLKQALGQIANEEPDVNDIITKIETKVQKVVDKWAKDDRVKEKGTPTQAKALVEEFVEALMGSFSAVVHEKPWFAQVSWTHSLLMIVLHTFEKSKMFARVLKPKLLTFIEDGFFKWQEEERITNTIWEAVVVCGVLETHQKKANQHLMKSFDDAHFKAPYGSTTNDSPELAVLQDFTKGWMAEFVGRAYDVLENGLADGSKESQISTVAVLFQNLMDPNVACMPHEIATEITNTLGGLPAAPWPFIDECAQEVFAEIEAKSAPGAAKKRRMGW